MNINDILKLAGYEVLKETIDFTDSFDGYQHRYEIKFNTKKLSEIDKERGRGSIFGYDINATFTVDVKDVGFNGEGNLYIILVEVSTGEYFDTIEFQNGELID